MAAFTSPSASVPPAFESVPSYGGRPALKPSIYGFLVALYIFVGGIAGSAQIITTLLDLAGPAGISFVIMTGRILAFAGAVAGGILLIVELHTPQRFYNMLRIFRPTSPMSIGSYVLTSFGFFSLLALAGQLLDWRWLAVSCGVAASVIGILMACYPAALLSATSTPLWSAAPRLLAIRFGAASMASGAAILCLTALWAGPPRLAAVLAAAAAASLLAQLTAWLLAERVYKRAGVNTALRGRLGVLHTGAELLGGAALVLFLLIVVFPAATTPLLFAASLCVLVGGLTMRDAVLRTGNESARDPADYFRLARADNPANGAANDRR